MKRTSFYVFLIVIGLGMLLATPDKPFVSSWWSVIYPDFYRQDIQLLPEEQQDQVEIRWRSQELWQRIASNNAHQFDIDSTASALVFDLP